MLLVEIAVHETALAPDPRRAVEAVRRVLETEGYTAGQVSLAVVDDPTIHALNRRFLAHDEPTDCLSFVHERRPGSIEGEIIASADTAAAVAARLGADPHDELLLYFVHGALHLAGYDDLSDEPRRRMRAAEARHCAALGLEVRAVDEPAAESGPDEVGARP